MLSRDPNVLDLRRGCRLFRRRVPRDRRVAEEIRRHALLRYADRRRRHRRRRDRHGRLRPAARASKFSSPITSIRPSTRSSPKRRGCAIARPAISLRRSPCARPMAAAFSAARRTARARRRLFTHVAGMTTVIPSTPFDAKGLLIAAIEDDDPVIFLEPKRIYNGPFDGHYDRPSMPWAQARGERSARGSLHRPARQGGGRARRRRCDACWPTARWCMWRWPLPRTAASTPK